jgi:hypothetical protein
MMEVPDRARTVSPDGRAVVFTLSIGGREVDGVIARDALAARAAACRYSSAP